jgi:hypothetical protein
VAAHFAIGHYAGTVSELLWAQCILGTEVSASDVLSRPITLFRRLWKFRNTGKKILHKTSEEGQKYSLT